MCGALLLQGCYAGQVARECEVLLRRTAKCVTQKAVKETGIAGCLSGPEDGVTNNG